MRGENGEKREWNGNEKDSLWKTVGAFYRNSHIFLKATKTHVRSTLMDLLLHMEIPFAFSLP